MKRRKFIQVIAAAASAVVALPHRGEVEAQYGRSPAQDALGDIRLLSEMRWRKLNAHR